MHGILKKAKENCVIPNETLNNFYPSIFLLATYWMPTHNADVKHYSSWVGSWLSPFSSCCWTGRSSGFFERLTEIAKCQWESIPRWFDLRYVGWKKQQKLNNNEIKNNLKNGGPQGAQNSKVRKFWNSGSLYFLIESHFDLIEKRPLFILTGLHRPHSLDSREFYCSWKGATLTRK